MLIDSELQSLGEMALSNAVAVCPSLWSHTKFPMVVCLSRGLQFVSRQRSGVAASV